MITTFEFHQLLEKWKKHDCTPEEEKLLTDMFANAEQETKHMMLSELEFMEIQNTNDDIGFDTLLRQIKNKIRVRSKEKTLTKHAIIRFSKIAAVFISVLVTGGILSYVLFSANSIEKVSYFQVKAPYGGRSELTLPDGSKVWLNAGSNLQYNDGFNKSNRNLKLEGEGYFKVAKNKKLPFIVNAADIKIRAVGTEFNVKAYTHDNIIETTLIEGKITLEKEGPGRVNGRKVSLGPYQKAIYVKNSEKVDINILNKLIVPQDLIPVSTEKDMFISKKIDPLPDIAWKENKLIFKRVELETMSVTLERKYNITIRFGSKEVKKIRFTGTLEDETLQQVLDVIKLTAPIDYTLKGREVTIYENATAQKEFIKHLKKQ